MLNEKWAEFAVTDSQWAQETKQKIVEETTNR